MYETYEERFTLAPTNLTENVLGTRLPSGILSLN